MSGAVPRVSLVSGSTCSQDPRRLRKQKLQVAPWCELLHRFHVEPWLCLQPLHLPSPQPYASALQDMSLPQSQPPGHASYLLPRVHLKDIVTVELKQCLEGLNIQKVSVLSPL